MIKRTVEVANAAHISSKYQQLVIVSKTNGKQSIPIADLGVLILSHPGITLTQAAITNCLNENIVVLFCDAKYMPQSVLLPLSGHTLHTKILATQIAVLKPLRKSLWKSIIQEKIKNQAKIINLLSSVKPIQLMNLAKRVKSGDPDNIEGQSASVYWRRLMGKDFRRDPDLSGTNAFLNYGYAILRAAVARALVGAGFHPSIGLHHHNQYNALCLADDLMEPLRPLVDSQVYQHLKDQDGPITPEHKQVLLNVLYLPCSISNQVNIPLITAMHYYAASLRKVITKEEKTFVFPKI